MPLSRVQVFVCQPDQAESIGWFESVELLQDALVVASAVLYISMCKALRYIAFLHETCRHNHLLVTWMLILILPWTAEGLAMLEDFNNCTGEKGSCILPKASHLVSGNRVIQCIDVYLVLLCIDPLYVSLTSIVALEGLVSLFLRHEPVVDCQDAFRNEHFFCVL